MRSRRSSVSTDKNKDKHKRKPAQSRLGAEQAGSAQRSHIGERVQQAANEQRFSAPGQARASSIEPAEQAGRQQNMGSSGQQQQQADKQHRQQAPQKADQQPAAPPIQMPTFKMVVNRPSAIVIDLLGVLVCRSFMSSSKEFRDFFQHNVLEYLNDNWKQKQLKIMINFFRCSQQNVPDDFKLADREESREDQIKQAKKHVIWKLRNDPTNSALSLFMLGITEWGYKNRLLQTAIYEEVPYVLKYWKEQLKIPIYVGVGSADFLVMVLSNTSAGNLIPFFHGHMNIMDFDGTRANKDFRKLANLLRMAPEKILYLTRFRQDCRRALETGMQSLIVLRSDFDTHGLVREIKAKRVGVPMLDGTRLRFNPDEAASPPSGRNLPAEVKNTELKNQVEKNINMLSLIDDHDETDRYNTQSSQIVEQDLPRYNIVLHLTEIAFRQ